MRKISFLILFVCYTYCLQAQDTIIVKNSKATTLPTHKKVYVFIPQNAYDSVIILNSKAYKKLLQDKESCQTFIDLYKTYKDGINKGDKEVQKIIYQYDVLIKVKDSSYLTLLQQYYVLNSTYEELHKQSTDCIQVSKKTLDSLSRSFDNIQKETILLKEDIKKMNREHTISKLKFGLIGFAAGMIIALLLLN